MFALAVERRLHALSHGRALAVRPLLGIIAGAGSWYGAVMGGFACDSLARARLMLYAGLKVPILLLVTAGLCLPGFFALNAVAGLSREFARPLRAILAGQAAMALALCSLSPLIVFAYLSGIDHSAALLANALAFAAATAIGQLVMRRHYRALILEDARHRYLLAVWVVLYAFVGIQMGWLLRPFVGDPRLPVSFFREDSFSNAYLVVVQLVVGIGR